MELKDFIAETLKQLISGIQEAQTYAKECGAAINPRSQPRGNEWHDLASGTVVQSVEFDIAVTETSGKETKGGLAGSIAVFAAGTAGTSQNETSSFNRLRFVIPIQYPKQK